MSSSFKHSLEDLLEAYGDGNQLAFEEFFSRTKDPLYTYVLGRVHSFEAAEDIIQDVFLRVHRYVASSDRKEGHTLSWLFGIIRNCVHDYWIHAKHRKDALKSMRRNDLKESDRVEHLILFKEIVAQLQGEIESEEFNILFQRCAVDMSFDEIARSNGIRTDNARQKFSRILKKVRQPSASF